MEDIVVAKIVAGLKEEFSWLTVPMEIEMEISRLAEHNGNFAGMKEFELKDFKSGAHEDYIHDIKEAA